MDTVRGWINAALHALGFDLTVSGIFGVLGTVAACAIVVWFFLHLIFDDRPTTNLATDIGPAGQHQPQRCPALRCGRCGGRLGRVDDVRDAATPFVRDRDRHDVGQALTGFASPVRPHELVETAQQVTQRPASDRRRHVPALPRTLR